MARKRLPGVLHGRSSTSRQRLLSFWFVTGVVAVAGSLAYHCPGVTLRFVAPAPRPGPPKARSMRMSASTDAKATTAIPGPLPLTVGVGTCLVPEDALLPDFLSPLASVLGRNVCTVREQVGWALSLGYRLVDTAYRYGNEGGVGRALSESFAAGATRREDVFVTTKVSTDAESYADALESVDYSLGKLGLEYIDLMLIHWPCFSNTRDPSVCRQRRSEIWRGLERAQDEGKVQHIGVANFGEKHLRELLEYARVRPAVDQIEVHPFNARARLVDFCRAEGIQVMGYSPLGGRNAGGPGTGLTDQLLGDPVIGGVAARLRRTSAQVILRWALQRGITPIPKASSEARLAENFDVLDFELGEEDMARIGSLDRGEFVLYDADVMP